MHNVQVKKINTLIGPNGQKKAFVKLDAATDALDVANRIGLI
jgi:large subunit ribosomal protein L23Ae